MSETVVADIPFERQIDPASNRMCGPAALCMVYRSFGLGCSQTEVAAKVIQPGATAPVGARTYLLARDALARGLSALVLRAKDPLRFLQASRRLPVRVILNHRSRPDGGTGHYSVLLEVGPDNVVVHDPLVGPNTRVPVADLLKLWLPSGGVSEVTGNVLVAIAKDPLPAAPCPACGTRIPDALACPRCRKSVALRPAAILGCMNVSCPERAWEMVFCPHCDADLTAAAVGDPLATPKTIDVGAKIRSAHQEIDRLVAVMLAVNKGQPLPGTEGYFATIRAQQAKMLALQNTAALRHPGEVVLPTLPPPPQPNPPPPPAIPPRAPRPPVDWTELGYQLCAELLGGTGASGQSGATADGREAAARQPTAQEIVDDLRRRGMIR